MKEKLKEQIGVLKLWLSFTITASFAMIGYIFTGFGKVANWQIILAGCLVIPFLFAIIAFQIKINSNLDQLGRE